MLSEPDTGVFAGPVRGANFVQSVDELFHFGGCVAEPVDSIGESAAGGDIVVQELLSFVHRLTCSMFYALRSGNQLASRVAAASVAKTKKKATARVITRSRWSRFEVCFTY